MRTWMTDLLRWPARSQSAARRNARQAAIALAHQRREREQVDQDVDKMLGRRSSPAGVEVDQRP